MPNSDLFAWLVPIAPLVGCIACAILSFQGDRKFAHVPAHHLASLLPHSSTSTSSLLGHGAASLALDARHSQQRQRAALAAPYIASAVSVRVRSCVPLA